MIFLYSNSLGYFEFKDCVINRTPDLDFELAKYDSFSIDKID